MDQTDLDVMVEAVITAHAEEWDRFCSGDENDRKRMAGFFTGQVMKATKGQADGKTVAELLARKADAR
jgi:aspartyl-tRNA(Asn)/glutamyl-tRNA(Gln) amidotransferase subunit B